MRTALITNPNNEVTVYSYWESNVYFPVNNIMRGKASNNKSGEFRKRKSIRRAKVEIRPWCFFLSLPRLIDTPRLTVTINRPTCLIINFVSVDLTRGCCINLIISTDEVADLSHLFDLFNPFFGRGQDLAHHRRRWRRKHHPKWITQ